VTTHQQACRTALVTAALLACALSIGAAGASAQESGESSLELGLWKRISATEMIYVPLAVTRADEVDHAEGLAGASYDRVFGRRLSARAGYRYSWELSPPSDTVPYREHRAVAEMTALPWPDARIPLLDRTRLELRWIDGAPSWRLRNRIRAEKTIAIGHARTLTPYSAFEGGYDSRYHTINRLRLSVGGATKLSSLVMVDTYAARQRDSRSDAATLLSVGMTLNLVF